MNATIFLVLFMLGDSVKIVTARTVPEICGIKRAHKDAIVFRVDGYNSGKWTGPDAAMHGVLVECADTKK